MTLAEEGLEKTRESCTVTSIWWSLYIFMRIQFAQGNMDGAVSSIKSLTELELKHSIAQWFLVLSRALKLKLALVESIGKVDSQIEAGILLSLSMEINIHDDASKSLINALILGEKKVISGYLFQDIYCRSIAHIFYIPDCNFLRFLSFS